MATEKRMIDANALMDAFRSHMVESYNRNKCTLEENCKTCEPGCLWRKKVNAAPTVDAVEVVHSQWDTVFYERNGTLSSYSHLCPECKYFYRDVRFKGHNYCPSCGADMRERKDNE